MKVCFIYSNRGEYSILQPFIKYFKKKVDTKTVNLSKKVRRIEFDKNLYKIYLKCFNDLSSKKYDYVCIFGDRRELPFAVLASFFLDIKAVHIGAGEFLEGLPTYDQIIRPVVTILSYFQICFSKEAKDEVIRLFSGISNLNPRVHVFGNPVFKGINFKKLRRPIKESYDLVLLHPQSLSRKKTEKDVKKLRESLKKKRTVFIYGNKDRNSDVIEGFYQRLKSKKRGYAFYRTLPKEKYFRYVKYCDSFYTNTSSISEIKFLNKRCLRIIGERNKNRTEHKLNESAPELLYNLLKTDYKK